MSGLHSLGGLGHGVDDTDPAGDPSGRRQLSRRALVAVLALLVLLTGAGVVVAHQFTGLFGTSDYSGDGTGSVVVQVHAGDTARQIGQTLTDDHVVASVGAFVDAADNNAASRGIAPGFYRLHLHMQASLALALLLNPASIVQSRVVVPEGLTAAAVLRRITAADPQITAAQLAAAAADPAALGLPSWAGGKLEGFLWPATYDVPPGTTAAQVLHDMVTTFQTRTQALGLAAAHGLSAYQVLTLASIVQREGQLVADYPRIAEVFLNRLRARMPLGSNATLYYVLPAGHGSLTAADLALDSPYNTEHRLGLPPTPINSPGAAAISAVLHAPSGPYLYFVTIDKAGHTGFATTYSEFQRLVAESQANGVTQ